MTATSGVLATEAGLSQAFVLVARRMRLGPGGLVLDELAPSTVVVTWGPYSDIRPISTAAMLDTWWARGGSEPLGATLHLMDPEACRQGPFDLLLRAPRISGAGLRWDATPISTPPPTSSGACVLILQPPEAGDG